MVDAIGPTRKSAVKTPATTATWSTPRRPSAFRRTTREGGYGLAAAAPAPIIRLSAARPTGYASPVYPARNHGRSLEGGTVSVVVALGCSTSTYFTKVLTSRLAKAVLIAKVYHIQCITL